MYRPHALTAKTLLAGHPNWVAQLRGNASQPPLVDRVPLWCGASLIGSVEPEMARQVGETLFWRPASGFRSGWEIVGEPTDSLARLALALRSNGLAAAWRDELLAVTDQAGQAVAVIERAVVRALGITTHAVHLVGRSPDGRYWVQQRSLDKPNDPGLWDTLMGGMVPASDTLPQALARETLEEAGLRLEQLQGLARGGRVTIRRPSNDSAVGYMVEHIDWFRCVVPSGVEPVNQDGEVAQFRLLAVDALVQMLVAGEFTVEASLILVDASS